MQGFDRARWQALSPLLDELLDLAPADRPARLAALRAQDAALADDLAQLLAREAQIDARGFMAGSALPPPPALTGQRIGAYTLERELGRGGMGQVWLARRTDGRYDGHVAIKLLHGGLRSSGDAERFAREGRILARLDQRHIARLLDAGVTPDGAQPYLVLEYVDGEPIDAYVERLKPPLAARLRLMIDAAEAVAHAHARLILHRDLKPSNMLVRHDGELKLLDFGVAKLLDEQAEGAAGELTQRAGQAYTPTYAAPEQLQGQDVTTATDVYALGVLLHELLGAGHPTAAAGATPLEKLRAAVETEPKRLSDSAARKAEFDGDTGALRRARELRGDLDLIVARALKKNPAERYANAAELAEDLRRTLAHEPIVARPDRWSYRAAKFVRRNRLAVGAATVTALALAGGTVIALQEAAEAQAQRSQAEGLIEFMLGDLRKNLAPVGRLAALDAVGERALAYYAAQDAGGLDAESLSRRARALHLIGEIAEQRGQLEEASQRFQEAARSTGMLMARHETDGARVFDHAQSEYWVGYVALQRGQHAAAEAAFERYRSLAQRLAQIDPQRADWRIEQGYAAQNLGVLQFQTTRIDAALASFTAARGHFEQLRGQHPEAQLNLSDNLGWIARVREQQANYEEAIAAQLALSEEFAVLARDGKDRRAERQQAVALHEASRLQLWRGQPQDAEPLARRATSAAQTLVNVDPSNLDWHATLGMAQLNLGEVLAAQGRAAEAQGALDTARRWLQPLWQRRDGKTVWTVRARARWLAAQAALPQDPGEATMWLADAMALQATVQAMDDSGKQLRPEEAREVAAALLALGDLQRQRQQTAAAHTHWRQALTRLQQADTTPASRTLRAQVQLRLGQVQESAAEAEKLRESPYRHPQFIDLQRRLGAVTANKERP